MFRRALPYYISIGMTPGDFWHGDPWLCEAYRMADEKAARRSDWLAWLNGSYVYQAIGDNAPVLNPLSKRPKARAYPKKPYTQQLEDEEREKTAAQRLENGRRAAKLISEKVARMLEKQQGGE